MDKIKQVNNAIVVLIANLLRFKPTSWKTSAEQTRAMAASATRGATVEAVDITSNDGKTINTTSAVPPLAYLLHALTKFTVATIGAWFAYQAIRTFIRIVLALLPFGLLAIGAFSLFSWVKKVNAAKANDAKAA